MINPDSTENEKTKKVREAWDCFKGWKGEGEAGGETVPEDGGSPAEPGPDGPVTPGKLEAIDEEAEAPDDESSESGSSSAASGQTDYDLSGDIPNEFNMISHPKDVFNPANREQQPIGMRYSDVERLSQHTDKPTLLSWVMHGPEKLMCPGTASAPVDVLCHWMIQASITIPDYSVLAYDLLPLDGEVAQWKTEGRYHTLSTSFSTSNKPELQLQDIQLLP